MTRTVSKLFLAITLFAATACTRIEGNGKRVDEERKVSSFDRISIHNAFELRVVVGGERSVHLIGDENIIEEIRTTVSGGHLDIGLPEMTNWESDIGVRVEITVPELTEVSRSGGGLVDVRGISANNFRFEASGGGTAYLAGRATNLDIETSGGTDTNARDLTSQRATISVSGGGTVDVSASDEINVEASGGSEVNVWGRPSVNERDLSGGSELNFR